MLAAAARLWWRHWPVLFVLYFFGLAAKQWLLQAGVWASRIDATLGLLVFLTGPLVMLTCFVLMLMVVRQPSPAEPALAPEAGVGAEPGARARRVTWAALGGHLRQLTSLLIPFLGVYAALGLLRSDFSTYYYEVFVAETLANAAIFTDPGSVNVVSRLPFAGRMSLIAALVVVVVLRWLVPRWQDTRAWLVVALISAYLELLWVGGLARQASASGDWLQDRQVFAWISTAWTFLADAAGPAGDAVAWVGRQLGDAETVLLAPVAWLLLGLVVSQRGTAASLDDRPDAPAPRWLTRLPGPVRWLGDGIVTDLRTRFGPLANGVRVMFRVGLMPMALLCLLVAALFAGSRWLWELDRLVIGPQELWSRWAPLSYWLTPINDAIAIVAVTCVVAAVVERVRVRRLELLPGTPDTRQPGDGASQPGGVSQA